MSYNLVEINTIKSLSNRKDAAAIKRAIAQAATRGEVVLFKKGSVIIQVVLQVKKSGKSLVTS
jgi:hypothetical protein